MPSFDFAGSSVLDRHTHETHETVAGRSRTSRRRGINLVQLHDELWRVTRADGDVLGYVESFSDPRGTRYRSKRLIPLHKRFVELGDFWSFDDAVDCLRFG